MKNSFDSQRFLTIYSGVLTVVFAVTILGGFATSKKIVFEEITAQRVNIIEPNGTLRMVISDKALFPGIYLKGQEHPHPNRKTAGMLFFNDEGTENGGLTFGGGKDKNGQVSSYGHLSFDEYEQDQVFTIDASQQGSKRRSGLSLVDDPDYPIGELIAVTDRIAKLPPDQQKAEVAKFADSHGRPHQRLYLGRGDDRSVALKFKDVEGHDRIVIQVAADGSPVIRFLDQNGGIVSELPGPAK